MAIVVPADAPSPIATAFLGSYDKAQARKLEKKRLEMTERYQKALINQGQQQVDFYTSDIKREIDVLKARGMGTEAEAKQLELNTLNSLTSEQRIERVMAKANAVKNKKLINQLTAQSNAANQQIKLMQQQLQFGKFKEGKVQDEIKLWSGAIGGVEGAAMGKEMGDLKVSLMNQELSPEARAGLTEDYASLRSDAFTMASATRDREQEAKKEFKRHGDYSSELYKRMPLETQTYAENYFDITGELAPLKIMDKGIGWFPGKVPGMFPFAKGKEEAKILVDKQTALGMGFTENLWNSAPSPNVPTVESEVDKKLKDRPTKEGKKGNIITGADGKKYRILDNSSNPDVELVE